MRRRSVPALLLAGGLLFATTGCSPDIQTGGNKIADPKQPLATALQKLKTDNEAGIQNNSVTVSDQTDCFYLKPSADADDISSSVACPLPAPRASMSLSFSAAWTMRTVESFCFCPAFMASFISAVRRSRSMILS